MLRCAQRCAPGSPSAAPSGRSTFNPFNRDSVLRAIDPGSASAVALSYRVREDCFGRGRSLDEHGADDLLACNEIGIQRPSEVRGGVALPDAAWPRVLALLSSPEAPCPATRAVLEADISRRRTRSEARARGGSEGMLTHLEKHGYAVYNRSVASAIAAQFEHGALSAVGRALTTATSRHGVTSLSVARASSGWASAGVRSAAEAALRPLLRPLLQTLQVVADGYFGGEATFGGVVLLRLAGRNLSKREYGSGMW